MVAGWVDVMTVTTRRKGNLPPLGPLHAGGRRGEREKRRESGRGRKAGGQVDGLSLWEGGQREGMEGGKESRKRLRKHGLRKG